MIDAVTEPITLTTERLILRPWRESDLEPFAAMNADPEVMRFFPRTLDRAASDAMAHRISGVPRRARLGAVGGRGQGRRTVHRLHRPAATGLRRALHPGRRSRLAAGRSHWGRGYAPEGAAAALDHAFGPLGLDEVVSMTIPANLPSQRVMQKLGLTRDPADDFDHPNLPDWAHAPARAVPHPTRSNGGDYRRDHGTAHPRPYPPPRLRRRPRHLAARRRLGRGRRVRRPRRPRRVRRRPASPSSTPPTSTATAAASS